MGYLEDRRAKSVTQLDKSVLTRGLFPSKRAGILNPALFVVISPESFGSELDAVTSKLNVYNPDGLQASPHNGMFPPVFDIRSWLRVHVHPDEAFSTPIMSLRGALALKQSRWRWGIAALRSQ